MEKRRTGRPGERILIGFNLLFGMFVLYHAIQMKGLESLSSPGAFPIFIGSVLIFTSLSILWKNRRQYASYRFREELEQGLPFVFPFTVLFYGLLLVLYIFSLAFLNFFISSYLFLVASFIFLKGTTAWRSFLIAAGMLAAVYFIFQYIFKVILW